MQQVSRAVGPQAVPGVLRSVRMLDAVGKVTRWNIQG